MLNRHQIAVYESLRKGDIWVVADGSFVRVEGFSFIEPAADDEEGRYMIRISRSPDNATWTEDPVLYADEAAIR